MKHVVLTAALVCAVASSAFAQLGSIGTGLMKAKQIADIKITDEEEVEIGKQVSQNIRQRYGVVQDKAVHRYVSLVGMALVTQTQRANLPWQFIVLDTDGVNAFAAPGGFVHVTKGALALMKNEAELADVLGHEVMHVTERHTIKAIQKGKMKDLGLDVAPGGGLSKMALSKLADAATDAVLAGFGRAEELEADDLGIVVSNKVGYDPHGLGTFLTRLKERNSSNTAEKRGLFASHPEMDERLKKLDAKIAAAKLTATATLEDRYKKTITYVPKAQTEITQVAAGSAGLAGGSSAKPADKSAEKKDEEPPAEEKKKGKFGLGKLVPGSSGGEEKKSAQVTGSGAGRGVDTERNAKGGDNPAIVAVTLTPKDLEAFKKEGKLN
jgi:beta-barrel assembly-enhancing protease